MKKSVLPLLLSGFFMCVAGNATASTVSVQKSMEKMSISYRSMMKDNDINAFKKDLSAFKLSAQAAQKTSLNDSGKVTFDEGMKKLLNEVTLIEQKAQTQSISEVKTEARKLRSIMEQYHSKLGV
ncbi:hypothetical protein A9B99_17815 [Mangrovibacter phragmitis]|jgi:soluble cytochrome b562|uniref:Soluble cytochrome b562 n=1 Tax=Mangrovibacter phragmitis TaxID=1691903 RepID=A0A1B7KY02_9ENTR|nr:cytochrome b562 [Mangrovibacter phragmitis]OAT75032.1 hypothetical protein A9B99_17815 [Mangrovibacter phragmitis]